MIGAAAHPPSAPLPAGQADPDDPGPYRGAESVLLAMRRPSDRPPQREFQAIVQRTTAQLKWFHQTDAECAGAHRQAERRRMEAGIINVLSTGTRCSAGDNEVRRALVKGGQGYGPRGGGGIEAEWGQPLDPEAFRTAP